MRTWQSIVAVVALTACLSGVVANGRADDHGAEAQIRSLMSKMFDRPEQRLDVGPVVVAGDHAIAGWAQGEMGGRALLRRKGHEWQLVLCSGDQIRSADALTKIGLPQAVAKDLAARLALAETKLAPDRLAMFSRFDGIVMMDAAGQHPPHGPAAPSPSHGPAPKVH